MVPEQRENSGTVWSYQRSGEITCSWRAGWTSWYTYFTWTISALPHLEVYDVPDKGNADPSTFLAFSVSSFYTFIFGTSCIWKPLTSPACVEQGVHEEKLPCFLGSFFTTLVHFEWPGERESPDWHIIWGWLSAAAPVLKQLFPPGS